RLHPRDHAFAVPAPTTGAIVGGVPPSCHGDVGVRLTASSKGENTIVFEGEESPALRTGGVTHGKRTGGCHDRCCASARGIACGPDRPARVPASAGRHRRGRRGQRRALVGAGGGNADRLHLGRL